MPISFSMYFVEFLFVSLAPSMGLLLHNSPLEFNKLGPCSGPLQGSLDHNLLP